jgi:hypothetical protein
MERSNEKHPHGRTAQAICRGGGMIKLTARRKKVLEEMGFHQYGTNIENISVQLNGFKIPWCKSYVGVGCHELQKKEMEVLDKRLRLPHKGVGE